MELHHFLDAMMFLRIQLSSEVVTLCPADATLVVSSTDCMSGNIKEEHSVQATVGPLPPSFSNVVRMRSGR
jgi:hypothetical protein